MSNYMDYSEALRLVKQGYKAACLRWEGLEWISITCNEGKVVPAVGFWSIHNRKHAEEHGGSAIVTPAITKKNKDGTIMVGWCPNSIDQFTDDWYIME